MLYNRCTGIYKFGNNTYPRRVRYRLNLGHIFQEKKVRPMGQEIQYIILYLMSQLKLAPLPTKLWGGDEKYF
jgi:hypothetical protein